MRFSAFLALAGMSILAACHSNIDSASRGTADAKVLTTADFEQSIGWGDASMASLTIEKAHSGKWSVRVKPDVPYGYTFSRTLGELSSTPLTKLLLEGWVLRTSAGSTAKLVVQVNTSATDNSQVFYTAFPVEQAVPKYGEWTAISVPITLPNTAAGPNVVKLYLWNDQGSTATYIDDITLRKAD